MTHLLALLRYVNLHTPSFVIKQKNREIEQATRKIHSRCVSEGLPQGQWHSDHTVLRTGTFLQILVQWDLQGCVSHPCHIPTSRNTVFELDCIFPSCRFNPRKGSKTRK